MALALNKLLFRKLEECQVADKVACMLAGCLSGAFPLTLLGGSRCQQRPERCVALASRIAWFGCSSPPRARYVGGALKW